MWSIQDSVLLLGCFLLPYLVLLPITLSKTVHRTLEGAGSFSWPSHLLPRGGLVSDSLDLDIQMMPPVLPEDYPQGQLGLQQEQDADLAAVAGRGEAEGECCWREHGTVWIIPLRWCACVSCCVWD